MSGYGQGSSSSIRRRALVISSWRRRSSRNRSGCVLPIPAKLRSIFSGLRSSSSCSSSACASAFLICTSLNCRRRFAAFLSAGLRQYGCCKEPTQQQSDKHSTYNASHFHTSSVIFSPYKIPIPVSRMDQVERNNYQYKNLATALLHELF